MSHRASLGLACLATGVATTVLAAFDWSNANWGIQVTYSGTPGSIACPIAYPGGCETGNALAVYYKLADTNWPQCWVFLTDGFWRQVAPAREWGTSYRLFRYYSSGNQDSDTCEARRFEVREAATNTELEVDLAYTNHAPCGDRFAIEAGVRLYAPTPLMSTLRASITVSNATGSGVAPSPDMHRDLAEQWELFGVSSMYVVSNLTWRLPAWYNTLDPSHSYVGTTNDANYLNDGYSVNGSILVSTHDVQNIVLSNRTVALDHDTNVCPWVSVPLYEWYEQLVVLDHVSPGLKIQHAYDSSRNHQVELLGAAGLTADLGQLKWAATYNRSDANMVDGDNIQVKLGLDDALGIWPANGWQTIVLTLAAGNTRPDIASFSFQPGGKAGLEWLVEPGETYAVESATNLGAGWTGLVQALPGPAYTNLQLDVPARFYRLVEEE